MSGKCPVPKKKQLSAKRQMARTLVASRVRASRKAKHRKSSKEEMYERRQLVMRMRLRGMTYKTIAKKLGVGTMTVRRDLAALRKDTAERVSKFDRDYALGECLDTYEAIHEEAWDQYHRCCDGSPARAQFLNIIRVAENDRVKVLMDVGMIGREAVKVEHNHKADEALRGITKDAQQLVAMALLKAQLQPPKEPIKEALTEGDNGQRRKLLDIPPEMVKTQSVDSSGNGV